MESATLPPALSASDRCDGSSSEQALVLLEHPVTGGRIQLCAHHFEAGVKGLLSWSILVDDRPRVLGGDFS